MRASSSARTIPSPGATGRTTSTVPAIACCVCSTMTTESAPAGRTAPVGIATAPPGTTATVPSTPIATSPTTSRYPGSPSDAPYVSAARTA